MLSAGSAIRNHQTYMDVIANNIANVNTAAYKSMRVTFHELLSQVVSPGAAPQAARGGINPVQIGLGMTLGGTDGVFTQGALQSTGRGNDLAIQGNGFFIFQGSGQNLYSRDGALDLGLDGSLVNASTGLRVLGWNADASGAINTTAALQPIMVPLNQGLAQASQNVRVNGNLDAALAPRSMSNAQLVANTVTGFATAAPAATPGQSQTELLTGDYYVEINNLQQFRVVDGQGNPVKIAPVGGGGAYTSGWQAATPSATIDTGRGLTITLGAGPLSPGIRGAGAASVHYTAQSITTNVQIYDSLGAQHTLTVSFTKDTAAPNQWTWQVTSDDNTIATLTPATAAPMGFNTTGQYVPVANQMPTISMSYNNGAGNQTISLDFAHLTQLAQASDLGVPAQDGYAPGQLTGFTISANGEVECNYANGMRKVLAQLALANFANPGGMLRVGDNMFTAGANSGAPTTGSPNTGGRGGIVAGYLENANVDLAQQFTSMITAQRGFQANSRVISASDQMLQDLVNLVR
jgi:flagellar hook protein FlgE